MALKKLLTTVAICFAITATAQADKVKLKARVSAEREVADNLLPKSAVQTNDGRTVLVFRPKDPNLDEKTAEKTIPKFDLYDPAKLTLIRTLEVSEKLGKQHVVLEDLITFQNEPVVFGTVRDLANGEVSVVYSKVDPNLTRAGRPYEEVVAFSTGLSGEQVAMGHTPGRTGPLFTTSPDTKTMLIASPEIRDANTGRAMFLLAAIGENFSEKWKHIVEVEEGLDRTELIDAAMDASGNAWILVRYDHKGRKASKGEVESEVKLFHVGEEGIRGIRFGLDRNLYTSSARLHSAKNGTVTCAGMVSASGTGKNPNMLFVAELPKTPNDLAAPRLLKDPFASDGKKMVMRDILRGDDGATHLLIEEYEYASIPHPKTLKQSMKHVHGSVHILKVDGSGAPAWNTSILRLAHTEGKYLGNLHPVIFNNELILFMLDSDKLVERRAADGKGISPADMSKPYTAQYMFSEKGEPRAKKIIDTGYEPTLIAGRQLYPIGKDRYFAFGSRMFEGGGYVPVDIEFSK